MPRKTQAQVVENQPKTVSLSETGQLGALAKHGEQQALEELLKRIQKRLYRFCLHLTGNPSRAQDLSQDAFLKVIEHIHTLENPNGFVSWMLRITKNIFLDYVTHPKNKPHVDLQELKSSYKAPKGAGESGLELSQALKLLTDQERYVVLLIHLEGRTYTEAAELLGVSEEAVRCKLYRIKRNLKKAGIHGTEELTTGKVREE